MNFCAFLQALTESDFDRVKELVSKDRAIVNCREGPLLLSPLFHAVLQANLPMTQLLLKLGADPNLPNSAEETPLHRAAEDLHEQLAQELIIYSADPNSLNAEQEGPLHIAVLRGGHAMVELLLQAGADPHATSSGKTLVDIAIEKGDFTIEKLLTAYGDNSSVDYGLQTIIEATDEEGSRTLEPTLLGILNSLQDTADNETECSEKTELYGVLKGLGMERHYCAFAAMKVLSVEQAKKADFEVLRGMGLSAGHAIQLLLQLELIASGANFTISYSQSFLQEVRQSEGQDPLKVWLGRRGLGHLYGVLAGAGYRTLDLLVLQMNSKYPLTAELLTEIGVSNQRERALLFRYLLKENRVKGPGASPMNCTGCSCMII